MSKRDIYATPKTVKNIEDCFFYHTMDVPGYGHVKGYWDLRENVNEYLGGVNFKGKRVLEMGTASGFACFHMESQGAEVVAYDLSEEQAWDLVPFSRRDYTQLILARKGLIRNLNNSYWLSHGAHNSKAKVVYGNVYEVPEEIGRVDIATFGCLLLHVRDPFLALQRALRLTRETVIVTEPIWRQSFVKRIADKWRGSYMTFLPQYGTCQPDDSWWVLTPEVIKDFIGVLGFEKSEVKYHYQNYSGRKQLLFTVVGHRTKETQLA